MLTSGLEAFYRLRQLITNLNKMNVQDLNDLANEVAVQRIMIKQYEEAVENLPGYKDLQEQIAKAKAFKDEAQGKLMEAMKTENLKSWKTDQANFARATRYSVATDPAFKKQVELRLKEGETVEGFTLNETEYLSIRNA